MSWPRVTFRSELPPTTRKELDLNNARLRGWQSNEHKSNGSHADITADSLVVTGDAEFEGPVTLDDDLTVTGDTTLTGDATVHNLDVLGYLSLVKGLALVSTAARTTLAISGNTSIGALGGTNPWEPFTVMLVTSAASTPVLFEIRPSITNTFGAFFWLVNTSANSFSIIHRSGSVAMASARINCPGGVDYTCQAYTAILCYWDHLTEMWYLHGPDQAYTLPATLALTSATVVPGASAITAKVGGIIYQSITGVGNVGAGDDPLIVFTIAANVLSVDGQRLTAEFNGRFAANGNDKRIRIKWNSATILDMGASLAPNGVGWRCKVTIVRTGAATQRVSADLIMGTASGQSWFVGETTGSATLSGTVALQANGEATSDNDIVNDEAAVWWHPVP
jgi:hypothetical protein